MAFVHTIVANAILFVLHLGLRLKDKRGMKYHCEFRPFVQFEVEVNSIQLLVREA